ncbi:hypothetical protein ACHAXR_012386 [Thalassiosira sp. AJA248-18]
MNDAPPQYNSQTVIDAAEAKLQGEGVNAAQTVFQSALLDWVDDVTMGDMGHGMEGVRGEIANLWLAYANLNRRSNLNKSATEVYEQATNCPVAGEMGKIWLEYTQFLEERGRPRTAQKLYLRALVGEGSGEEGGNNGPSVKDLADQALLWNGFLRMMQSLRKNPDLTLEDLKKAVEKERLGQSADSAADQTGGTSVVPDQPPSSTQTEPPQEDAERPSKRSRWDQKAPVETEKVSAGSIDTAAGILATTSKNMPPEIETLWHARDGGSLPSRPEPPLFTASPPKLGDPSGKDLIGNETALKILKILSAKTHDGKGLGSALLELCNACWMMAALKEEEVVKAQDSLEKKIIADREAMEVDLDARASVAGGALAAVQQANENERGSFNAQSEAQRGQLLSSIAWEFRKLLYMQQIILTSAKVPGFDGPTVDSAVIAFQSKVCSVMHSAFYLRARVGEASHVNMLNKQLESLEKYIQTSVKNEPVEQPQYHPPFQVPQQPMQFQQPMMGVPPPPMMYAGPPPQMQPMMGVTPYQAMPMGFGQPMMQQQGQQIMQPPQQFMGQLNPPQFQPGQQNNVS